MGLFPDVGQSLVEGGGCLGRTGQNINVGIVDILSDNGGVNDLDEAALETLGLGQAAWPTTSTSVMMSSFSRMVTSMESSLIGP